MARGKKKPVTLAGPRGSKVSLRELGLVTSASRSGAIIEDVFHIDEDTGNRIKDPNGTKRARRMPVIERYHRRGLISDRQLTAAERLLMAWENTQRGQGNDYSKTKVDTSARPDVAVVRQMTNSQWYYWVKNGVTVFRPYVLHVVEDNLFLNSMPGYRDVVYMERLRKGLDALADYLDLGGGDG